MKSWRKFRLLLTIIAVYSIALPLFAAQPKKAVFIIASENFQDDEFARPYALLLQQGVQITVASSDLKEAVGMNGAKARVDMLLKDVKAENFDAVIFIGGSGASSYIQDPVALSLAQDAVKKRKVVGAICIAPLILSEAGVLKGKKATVYPTESGKLPAGGAVYSEKHVERDGRIITADGPDSASEFGQELLKLLKGS